MTETAGIHLTTTAYSDVGTLRKANEDSYYISESDHLLIACDGMGGQVAGGLASKIAVETIKDIYANLQDEQLRRLFPEIDAGLPRSARLLIAAVRTANRRLYNMAIKFPKLRGMGTTVVALTFDEDAATLVHVGDSRVFRISDNAITQLTEDHSWLNELIEDNEINEEQIETFSQKNVITRALGTAPTVKIDLHCEKYKESDIYVLCTDGLHNALTEEDVKEAFTSQPEASLEQTIKELIEKAKTVDGSDNITAAAAQVHQDCDSNSQIGISTTIAPEDPKNATRLDKFIQEKYEDAKMNLFGKARPSKKLRPYLTAGLAIFFSILFFVLGLNLQSKQGFSSGNEAHPANARSTNGMVASSLVESGGATHPQIGNKDAEANALRAQRSKVPSKDAVIAIVFFNSAAEYEQSSLSQGATVIDRFDPYLQQTDVGRSDFTIFLIDSSNNVIRKSAVEIPKYSEGE